MESQAVKRYWGELHHPLHPAVTKHTLVDVHLSGTCSGIEVAPLQECVHLRRLSFSDTDVRDVALASLLRWVGTGGPAGCASGWLHRIGVFGPSH